MAKKSLARKIMLSIFAGAVLFSNSIAWAETLADTYIKINDYDAADLDNGESKNAIASGKGAIAIGVANEQQSTDQWANPIEGEYFYMQTEAIGENSIAIGAGAQIARLTYREYDADVGGYVSITTDSEDAIAIGTSSTSKGIASISIGAQSITSGNESVALGSGADAGERSAVAIGRAANAATIASIALGDGTMATGDTSIAMGYSAEASGSFSIAMGNVSENKSGYSVALGSNVNIDGDSEGAIALGYGATVAAAKGAIAIGYESYADKANTVSVGNATTQRKIVYVADTNIDDENNGYDAVNVNTLKTALADVGGLDSAVTAVEFSKNDEKLDGKLTVTTTIDGTASSATIDLNEWADSKYATIANVQTVTGLSGWDADAVKTAYTSANNNEGTTYLNEATSLVDADIKLDAAINTNAEAIKNVYTKTESDKRDIVSGTFGDNTITLTKGDNSTITLSDIAKASDLSDLQTSLGATAAATIKGAKYTNDILTLVVGEEDTDGSGNDIKVEGIASQSALSTLSSKVTTLNTNVNGIIGVGDIATENALKNTYENEIGSSNTNYLANANTLVGADVVLNNAISQNASKISELSKNIGALDGLTDGINKGSIIAAINSVYEEAKKHTTVSAGNGVTVTGTTSGGSTETTDTNETTGTATGTGGTDYKVSANIGHVGDDNIAVSESTDETTKKTTVNVSLKKDITVDSVTVNGTDGNKTVIDGDNITFKDSAGNAGTTITNNSVNTSIINATTANITEKIVVGTEDSQTTIKGDTVTTTNVNTTNVTSSNVTVHNKFEFVDGENVTTTIDKDGMTTNNATVNNTFIVGDTTKNEYTKIDGDTVTITNHDGKTTTIKGDTINSTTINLGDNVTVNNEGMTIEGDTTNVIINKDGITFEGDDNTANGPSINNNGMDMNNTTISNVKDGEVSATSKDAVNGSQLYQEATERMIADQKLNSRLNKVGAGAAALAALHPLDFDPDDKLSFSAGVGNYAGENAAALGMFYRPNEKVMLSMGGTMGNGENMVNMGISFALDKPNNVSNSRVAMAKEIVAMREHIAKQDAQIAQLVMLVNQLTGNVAQQEATPAFSPSGRVRVERLTDGYEEYDRVKIEKGAELDGDNSKTVEAK